MPGAGADEYPRHGDGEDRVDDDDLEIKDDDDLRDDVAGLFGVNLGDDNVSTDVDVGDGDSGGVAASTDTHGTSSVGKCTSAVWEDFTKIKENKIRVAAICKLCGKRYSARSAAGTGHLIRH
jgi:hypothetical protein